MGLLICCLVSLRLAWGQNGFGVGNRKCSSPVGREAEVGGRDKVVTGKVLQAQSFSLSETDTHQFSLAFPLRQDWEQKC